MPPHELLFFLLLRNTVLFNLKTLFQFISIWEGFIYGTKNTSDLNYCRWLDSSAMSDGPGGTDPQPPKASASRCKNGEYSVFNLNIKV